MPIGHMFYLQITKALVDHPLHVKNKIAFYNQVKELMCVIT